jgi:hypothetical protein
MLIDPKPLLAFSDLDKREQSVFMHRFISTLTAEHAYQAVLLTCAQNGAWAFMSRFLKLPHARDGLWEIIDTLQSYAYNAQTIPQLMAALPKKFRHNEGMRALVYPFEIKNWELAEVAFEHGAAPGEQLFCKVCHDYTFEPNDFSKLFISRAIKTGKVNWKSMLAFNDYADGFDLISRAAQNDTRSLYVVASAVMSNGEKRRLLHAVTEKATLNHYLQHMEFPENWRTYLNLPMRALIFSEDLGV